MITEKETADLIEQIQKIQESQDEEAKKLLATCLLLIARISTTLEQKENVLPVVSAQPIADLPLTQPQIFEQSLLQGEALTEHYNSVKVLLSKFRTARYKYEEAQQVRHERDLNLWKSIIDKEIAESKQLLSILAPEAEILSELKSQQERMENLISYFENVAQEIQKEKEVPPEILMRLTQCLQFVSQGEIALFQTFSFGFEMKNEIPIRKQVNDSLSYIPPDTFYQAFPVLRSSGENRQIIDRDKMDKDGIYFVSYLKNGYQRAVMIIANVGLDMSSRNNLSGVEIVFNSVEQAMVFIDIVRSVPPMQLNTLLTHAIKTVFESVGNETRFSMLYVRPSHVAEIKNL